MGSDLISVWRIVVRGVRFLQGSLWKRGCYDVGRTSISPEQGTRELEVKLKLAVVKEAVAGRRVVVVDDSIVRRTTTRGKIRALRQAGARQIHMRVSCPPFRW